MKYEPGLWLFILSSLIFGSLLFFSWPYRKSTVGRNFYLLIVAAFIWAVNFTLETASISLNSKLFFSNIEFLGITFLPVFWLYLVLAYIGHNLSLKAKIISLVIPILTNIIIWTNPLHHWFMGNPSIDLKSASFPVLNMDYQFWFYFIHAPAGYIYILIAIFFLIRSIRKMEEIYKSQAYLLLLSIILPSVTDILYVVGFSPVKHYNYTTAVFSVSGIILLWTLFHFRFLDLLPIARDMVIENLDEGILLIDHKNRITFLNDCAMRSFNLDTNLIGMPLEHSQNEFLKKITIFMQQGITRKDILIGKPQEKYYDIQIAPVYNRNKLKIGTLVTSRDITDRTTLFKQVQSLSNLDSLTGIWNPRQFISLGKIELTRIHRRKDTSLAVVMIDLDNFKVINDTYGHLNGNKVLIAFTQIIQTMLREYDIFGRLGGDEFAILLRDVNAEEASTIVERLRSAVENLKVKIGSDTASITISSGIVTSDQLDFQDLEMEKMLKLADQALYTAKRYGRNRVILK